MTPRAMRLSITSALLSLGLLTGCPKPVVSTELVQLDEAVGGHQLRYHFTHAIDGGPTVVFENGLGDQLEVWNKVQTEAAKFVNTVSYDRAGVTKKNQLGSEAGPDPRTADLVARELKSMLVNAGIPGPYILCGHSDGGLFVRYFANQYPDEIAGLVLVDAHHEDIDNRQALELNIHSLELLDLALLLDSDVLGSVGFRGEYQNRDNTYQLVRDHHALPTVPLVVLSAGKNQFTFLGTEQGALAEAIHQELQQAQADLIPGATRIVVDGSGHDIHEQKPQAVIDAIQSVFTAAGY